MTAYLLRRALHSAVTVALLVGLLFVAFNLLGDPIRLMLPETASIEQIEAMRAAYGLDRPILVRFVDFYGNVLHGNFGTSIRYNTPALSLVVERLPATLLLAGAGMGVSMLGIPIGMLAARRPGRWF